MSSPTTDLHSTLIPECANRPGDDPIFALNAEAKRRADAGENVLNATIGALCNSDGSLSVMPSVFEAYRRIAPNKAAGYAPISGSQGYLDAVIDDLFGGRPSRDHAVAVATPGGTGAIHHAIVNTIEPGQKLLTSSYYWAPYAILADHTRRGVETFRMFDDSGKLDVEAFEAGLGKLMDEQGRALVILNTPCHNPTGYSLDADEWTAVAEICERATAKGPVNFLLDFAYAKFAPPAQSIWREYVERLSESVGVFVAWTASKSFAQYGARIGALVALHPDDAERARVGNALGYSCRGTWSNCNHHGMLAITEVLGDPELRAASERERDELIQTLAKRVEVFNEHARPAGLVYPRYEGGFFVTVFTPEARQAAEHMKERGVFVVPVGNDAVRAALCATPRARVPELVEALADGVRSVS